MPTRSCSGGCGRRRQLRHRDAVRVRPAPGLDGARRDADVPVRARRGGAARLPRLGGRRAGRGVDAGGDQLRPSRAVRADRTWSGSGSSSLVGCWCGDLSEGEAALAPLRGLGPVVDLFGPMPYPALQGMLDGGSPPGLRNYFRGGYVADLDDEVIAAVLEHAARMPSPMSQIHLHQMGGAVGRVRHRDVVVQRTSRRLHVQPHRDLDRPHRRRHAHRCRPPGVGRPRTALAGTSLRQLRRRQPERRQLRTTRSRGPVRLRRRDLRPAGAAETPVRPGEPVPPQPERAARAMSRFLILSWDGGGNTPSAYNLGARLAGRGHRVRMMGWAAMAGPAAGAGLEFTTYPSVATVARRPAPRGRLGPDRGRAVRCRDRAGHRSPRPAPYGADVLVVDCMLTAGSRRRAAAGPARRVAGAPALPAVRAPVGQQRPRHRRRRPTATPRPGAGPATTRLRPSRTATGQHHLRRRDPATREDPAARPSARRAPHANPGTRGSCSASAPPCTGRPTCCPGSWTRSAPCPSGCC